MGTISFSLPLSLERPLAVAGKGCSALLRLVVLWQDRTVTRTHLASLDDRALKDVGLTRADVEAEYAKPFWKG